MVSISMVSLQGALNIIPPFTLATLPAWMRVEITLVIETALYTVHRMESILGRTETHVIVRVRSTWASAFLTCALESVAVL